MIGLPLPFTSRKYTSCSTTIEQSLVNKTVYSFDELAISITPVIRREHCFRRDSKLGEEKMEYSQKK